GQRPATLRGRVATVALVDPQVQVLAGPDRPAAPRSEVATVRVAALVLAGVVLPNGEVMAGPRGGAAQALPRNEVIALVPPLSLRQGLHNHRGILLADPMRGAAPLGRPEVVLRGVAPIVTLIGAPMRAAVPPIAVETG